LKDRRPYFCRSKFKVNSGDDGCFEITANTGTSDFYPILFLTIVPKMRFDIVSEKKRIRQTQHGPHGYKRLNV